MTARAALMPPGPGMFSITTPWPNLLLSLSAMMREVTSATPPAPKGSTILTGFSGHAACACCAGASRASAISAKAALLTSLMAILPRSFLMSVETIEPGGIVHQQAPLRQRVGGILRHQIDQVRLIRLMRRIRVRKIGAPQHALRRRLDQRVSDRHRRIVGRHGNALGAADLDPAVFQARKL